MACGNRHCRQARQSHVVALQLDTRCRLLVRQVIDLRFEVVEISLGLVDSIQSDMHRIRLDYQIGCPLL